METKRFFSGLAIAACLLGASALAEFLWDRFQDPQGEETSACDKTAFQTFTSPDELQVVTLHSTICSGFGGSVAVYAYLHPKNSPESRSTLVFRYLEHDGAAPPEIVWVNSKSVTISLPIVQKITKQVTRINGIEISYRIGQMDYLP